MPTTRVTMQTDEETVERIRQAVVEELADAGVDPEQVELTECSLEPYVGNYTLELEVVPRDD